MMPSAHPVPAVLLYRSSVPNHARFAAALEEQSVAMVAFGVIPVRVTALDVDHPVLARRKAAARREDVRRAEPPCLVTPVDVVQGDHLYALVHRLDEALVAARARVAPSAPVHEPPVHAPAAQQPRPQQPAQAPPAQQPQHAAPPSPETETDKPDMRAFAAQPRVHTPAAPMSSESLPTEIGGMKVQFAKKSMGGSGAGRQPERAEQQAPTSALRQAPQGGEADLTRLAMARAPATGAEFDE